MRAVHLTSLLTATLAVLAACGGDDPGSQAGSGGSGGRGGGGRDSGATAGRGGGGGAETTAGRDAGPGMADASEDAGGEPPAGDGSFFPLVPGNSWTFRVTDGPAVSMKTQTIGDLEEVGGTGPASNEMAYRATTTKADGGDMTVSWQAEVDGKIVRYREQAFASAGGALELEEHWDPYKLRVDMNEEHLVEGAAWVEMCEETKLPVGMAPTTETISDSWRVVAADEPVTVPAGTFDALVLEKTGGGSSIKRYWFVRGVGKVKETGTQTEELASYDVM